MGISYLMRMMKDASEKKNYRKLIDWLEARKRSIKQELTHDILTTSKESWDSVFALITEGKLNFNSSAPRSKTTLLHEAANQGKLDIVKRLIESGADPKAKTVPFGLNALHFASMAGHLEVAKHLVEVENFDITECTNHEGEDALSISNEMMDTEDDPSRKENYQKLSDWLQTRKISKTSVPMDCADAQPLNQV